MVSTLFCRSVLHKDGAFLEQRAFLHFVVGHDRFFFGAFGDDLAVVVEFVTVAELFQAGAGGDELADDDVLLQAQQRIDLAA